MLTRKLRSHLLLWLYSFTLPVPGLYIRLLGQEVLRLQIFHARTRSLWFCSSAPFSKHVLLKEDMTFNDRFTHTMDSVAFHAQLLDNPLTIFSSTKSLFLCHWSSRAALCSFCSWRLLQSNWFSVCSFPSCKHDPDVPAECSCGSTKTHSVCGLPSTPVLCHSQESGWSMNKPR